MDVPIKLEVITRLDGLRKRQPKCQKFLIDAGDISSEIGVTCCLREESKGRESAEARA
jgi:hypothetical protein